jgi:hypothetical protein
MKPILKILAIWLYLSLQSFGNDVTLQWDPNPENDLAGYRVHMGLASGYRHESRDVGLTTIFVWNGLVDGVTYYFTVTAYNRVGLESGPSNELMYKVIVRSSPSKTMGFKIIPN